MFASILHLLALFATPATAAPTNAPATGVQAACGQEVYAAYWRTWNDVATGFAQRQARMDTLPKGTNIAIVFESEGADQTDYYRVLKETYVPALHAQGTQLVRTLGTKVVKAIPVPSTPDGYDQIARDLIAKYVTSSGLDGLDLDIEEVLAPAEVDHFANTIRALGKYLGPQGAPGTLLIYDTNQDGDTPLFGRVADVVSYVFIQAYGRPVSSLQFTWETYAPHIDSCRFLTGFTFYEERGARWGDTQKPFQTSRAGQYAAWQPQGGRKGGVFSYAVDRDWKAEGDDSLSAPTYEFTHEILKVQGKE